MTRTRISLIGEQYDCVKPLFDGQVKAAGVDLAVTRSPSPEAMRRQLTLWEFDICEMAFGAYLIARAQGADVTAIPVFPRRAFFHLNFACAAGTPPPDPHDLAGQRIGVAEYVQSATVWARGVLEHDFALDARKSRWYVERAGLNSTGEVLGFKPPRDLSVQQTPGGQTLVDMLGDQSLDLALVSEAAQAAAGDRLQPLFRDAVAEGHRFYRTHRYVPANHTYMIRGSLAREQPALVASLYRAFQESQAIARQALAPGRSPAILFGSETLARAAGSISDNPFSYGVTTNLPMLQTIMLLCQEQGLVRDVPAVDQLFVAGLD